METKDIRRANLAALLKEHLANNPKSTRADFAVLSGLAPAQLSQLTGENSFRNIGGNLARKIESSLNLPNGWLDTLQEDAGVTSNVSFAGSYAPGNKYPVISKVQAGAWSEAVESYSMKDIDLWLESDAHIQGDAFWLEVDGDSMTSPAGLSIPEGTFVLFDTGRDPANGNLVIAKLTDSNEATFKKLVIDGAQWYLKGLNPVWPLVPINGNCRIIGVAVETKLRLL
ncbi:LexA family transcriptional repressor [Rahnella sp. AA]|uniref:LexA family protein n=1 Tax=Rahnella sp. AA TaxID=2057180 RepID=UPI000C335DFE|nr:S24 family peptidase [Rahnella sp. AA]PKE30996.1 LexA family transcriptional repressor [Rahnella sp. AA]